ncbi:MAG: hypothetical protein ABWZ76_09970 [Acidimicrobiales bacterium]
MSSPSDDASTKSPVEATVEAIVYAPIGLLFEGASLLPQLVEKGKSHVMAARMVGKFAVKQASGRAATAAGKLQDQAAGVLDFIAESVTPIPSDPAPPAPVPKAAHAQRIRATTKAPVTKARARTVSASRSRASGAARQAARQIAGVTDGPARRSEPGTGLAIPDYDGLSASHVVNRLAGLSPAELESVRAYEVANRGRKTILSKVAQLQSA